MQRSVYAMASATDWQLAATATGQEATATERPPPAATTSTDRSRKFRAKRAKLGLDGRTEGLPTRAAILRHLWKLAKGADEVTPGVVNAVKALFELLPPDLVPEPEQKLASVPRGIFIHAEPLPRAELPTEPRTESGPDDELDDAIAAYRREEADRYGDIRGKQTAMTHPAEGIDASSSVDNGAFGHRRRNAHGQMMGNDYEPRPGPRFIGGPGPDELPASTPLTNSVDDGSDDAP